MPLRQIRSENTSESLLNSFMRQAVCHFNQFKGEFKETHVCRVKKNDTQLNNSWRSYWLYSVIPDPGSTPSTRQEGAPRSCTKWKTSGRRGWEQGSYTWQKWLVIAKSLPLGDGRGSTGQLSNQCWSGDSWLAGVGFHFGWAEAVIKSGLVTQCLE